MTQITKHFLSGKENVFGQGDENVTKLFSNEGLTIDNETLFIVQDFVVAVNETKDISESLGEITLQNILTGFKNFTKVQLIVDPDIQFGLNDTILPEEEDLLLKIKTQINIAAEKVVRKCSTTLCIQNITASDNILPTEFTDLGDLLSRENLFQPEVVSQTTSPTINIIDEPETGDTQGVILTKPTETIDSMVDSQNNESGMEGTGLEGVTKKMHASDEIPSVTTRKPVDAFTNTNMGHNKASETGEPMLVVITETSLGTQTPKTTIESSTSHQFESNKGSTTTKSIQTE